MSVAGWWGVVSDDISATHLTDSPAPQRLILIFQTYKIHSEHMDICSNRFEIFMGVRCWRNCLVMTSPVQRQSPTDFYIIFRHSPFSGPRSISMVDLLQSLDSMAGGIKHLLCFFMASRLPIYGNTRTAIPHIQRNKLNKS